VLLTRGLISQKLENIVQIFAVHTLERRNQQRVQISLLETIYENLPQPYRLLQDVALFRKLKQRSSKNNNTVQ
jgi:hypothetical protein